MMKLNLILSFLLFFTIKISAQTITGKVIDAATEVPLEYVSIGIINTPYGCITDKNGNFNLNVKGQNKDSIIRFSMISYKPQTFSIERLADTPNTIKLKKAPIEIAEARITPSNKTSKLGTTKFNVKGGRCGWNCAEKVKSFELGLRIEPRAIPIIVKSLHVNVHRQAFDTTLYRLHIRNIKNNLPGEELLTEDIIFPLTKESGWEEIDLRRYNIQIKENVALSLEWLDAIGRNDDRAMRINESMAYDYVLLKTRRKSGFMYSRLGREGKWNTHNKMTPSMYLTVYE